MWLKWNGFYDERGGKIISISHKNEVYDVITDRGDKYYGCQFSWGVFHSSIKNGSTKIGEQRVVAIRQSKGKDEEGKILKPRKENNIDWSRVLTAVQDHIDFIWDDNYNEDVSNKYENDIVERVIEAVYGEDIWDKINTKIEEHDNS